jgi:hypothetical protein
VGRSDSGQTNVSEHVAYQRAIAKQPAYSAGAFLGLLLTATISEGGYMAFRNEFCKGLTRKLQCGCEDLHWE